MRHDDEECSASEPARPTGRSLPAHARAASSPDATQIEASAIHVVGIGASAGGQTAVETFFENLVPKCGCAFVVVQDFARDVEALLRAWTAKAWPLEIAIARHGDVVRNQHVYLVPPNRRARLSEGRLCLAPAPSGPTQHPIDWFFQSLAEDAASRAIAVVLSGSGSDGTNGIRAVKSAGGLVVAQDHSASAEGMPRSAVRTGLVDFVLAPQELATRVCEHTHGQLLEPFPLDEAHAKLLASILDTVLDATGLDFRQYRPLPLLARIRRRVWVRKLGSLAAYEALLREQPGEAEVLARDLVVGVTSFFRDPAAFEAVRTHVLPALIAPPREVRAWVVGCSTGEEAYSLAILIEEYQRQHQVRIPYRIFATDVDERAIAIAGRGVFSAKIVSQVEPRLLEDCFVREGEYYRIAARIRERIVFAKHDVSRDAPFTKLDLVTCRNLMIYHERDLQERVLGTLASALHDDRFLWLGSSESLGTRSQDFVAVDAKWRIFKKVTRAPSLPRDHGATPTTQGVRAQVAQRQALREEAALLVQVCSLLVRGNAGTALVVDPDDRVLFVFGATSEGFLPPEGKPAHCVTELLQPALAHAVTALLLRARRASTDPVVGSSTTHLVTVHRLASEREADRRHLVLLGPLVTAGLEPTPGAAEPVLDLAASARLEELASEFGDRENTLKMTVEELEATTVELQCANAELRAANDEMRATIHELRSAQEESLAIQADLQRKLTEQHVLTSDMEHLLQTSEIGTIFLDSGLRVRRFTPAITRTIPLLPQDVGRPIVHLKHAMLDVDLVQVAENVHRSLAGIERQVRTISGETLLLRAVPYYDYRDHLGGVVMTLVDVTALEAARHELAEKEKRFRQVAENIDEVIWIREHHSGEFLYLSPVAESLWGRPTEDLVANRSLWFHAVHDEDRARVREGYLEGIAAGAFSLEYRIVRGDGTVRWVRDRGFPITDEEGALVRVAGVITDITSTKHTEEQLRSTAQSMRTLAHLDALTGLANRRGWEQHLHEELLRTRRIGETSSCVLIDCDDFKQINDRLGHSIGDQVLREVAARLTRAIRPSDFLARIGGDEFIVLLPSTRNAEALRVAERMRTSVADSPLWIGDREIRITVSLGVGALPPSATSSEGILAELHLGLSGSKRGGKNRVGSSRGDGTQVRRAEDLANLLRTEAAFRVYAQRIHDLADDAVVGFELLSRGPKGDLESPDAFFRTAIEHDMLTLVDMHCLRRCLRAAEALASEHPHGALRLHLNIYPSTILEMPEQVMQELFAGRGTNGSCTLELSEQQFVGEPTYLRARTAELRRLGIRIAIDDVGFGRSSLESLIVLEPDAVKIDRAFVSGASTEPSKRSFLRRLLQVTEGLGTEVVAEGVESREDAEVLRELGVRFAQGWFWDRPEPLGFPL